jgi:hypothetical protein
MTTPDWSRLPHDPEGFFGLAAGFDRKELKRQYNQLIKQFKPEKFPDEFQRIRAAYEGLDQALRYGSTTAPQFEIPKYHWGETESSPPQESAASDDDAVAEPIELTVPTPAVPSLRERLHTEPLSEVLASLRQESQPQPIDYFARAVLEESEVNGTAELWVHTLLAGLGQHPHDPGLSELLATYLKMEVTLADAAGVLLQVAAVIRDDRFFRLTEGLWDRYLRGVPFAEFRETLRRCEGMLVDHRIATKLIFCIHILRPAMWLGDDDWIDHVLEFVETESEKFRWRVDGDLDFLWQLREYRRLRAVLIVTNPLIATMDRVLRSYCLDAEAEFDQQFLQLSVELGAGTPTVLAAFPIQVQIEAYNALYRLWIGLDHEVSERHGIRAVTPTTDKLVRRATTFYQRLQTRSDTTTIGSVWQLSGWLYLLLKGGTYAFPAIGLLSLSAWMIPDSLGVFKEGISVSLIAIGLGLGWLLDTKFSMPLWNRFCRYWARITYSHVWRPEVTGFLKQTQLPYFEFLDLLKAAEDENIHCSGWVSHIAQGDYGLALISIAQRYRG